MSASAFPLVPFSSAMRDCTGGNIKVQRKAYTSDGELPVIDQGQDFIAGYTQVANQYKGALPLVLFGDHTRIFKYVDFPFALGADGVKALEPQEGFDAKFLFYYFRSVHLPSAGYSRHFKFLKEVLVPKPSLPKQRCITDLLSRAEGIVRLRREAEKKAAELIPALFLDMFGDPATNPKGWHKTPLSNLCATVDDIKCGPFGTQLAKSEFRLEGIPLWGIKHVNVGFTKPTVEFLSPEKAAELDTYSIKPGDIVMTRKGTIGNCALYPENMPNGIMHSDLLRIRASLDKCFPEFLADQLHISRDVENQIARTASSGAVMPGINVGRLKAILVLVPPPKKQAEYVAKIQQIRSIQSQQSTATAKAKSTFDALLAQAFSAS